MSCAARTENVTFIITTRCDSACQHCYQRDLPRRTDAELHGIPAIVKSLRPRSVTVSGGEPLLLNGIYDLLVNISSHTEKVYLYTNIKRLAPRKLPVHLRASLHLVVGWHAPSAQDQKLRALLADGWHVSAGIVGTRENIQGELIQQVPKGVRSIFLYYPTPLPKRVDPYGPYEWQELLRMAIDRLRHNGCAIFVEPAFIRSEDATPETTCPAWQQLVFDPDFRALPCCLALGNTALPKAGTGCPILADAWGGSDPRCGYSDTWVPACPLLITPLDGGVPHFPSKLWTHPTVASQRAYDRSPLLDLRRSTLQFPTNTQVVAAAAASLDQVNLYPISVEPLERRIAAALGILPERVVVTQSADGAIDLLARALPGPGAVFTPTFSQYRVALGRAGFDSRAIPGTDIARFSSLDTSIRTLWLASPGNPSGVAVEKDWLLEMAERLIPEQQLILDETLVEFQLQSPLTSLIHCKNIACIRSFSKAFGLSGLRIGYVVAAESLAAELRRLRLPYPVSTPAVAAATASLNRFNHFRRIWRDVRAEVVSLMGFLSGLGFEVPYSYANFLTVFFESPVEAARFRLLLSQEGILVLGEDSEEYDIRGFSGGFARICLPAIDDIPQLRKALEVVAEQLQETAR